MTLVNPIKGHVALVDDDNEMRSMLEDYFRSQDYQVSAFGSAIDALEKLRPIDPPDVIVSDIRMPKMDGLDFADKIKEKFPDEAARIEDLYASDEDFRTLCEDYFSCIQQLQKFKKEFSEKQYSFDEYKNIHPEIREAVSIDKFSFIATVTVISTHKKAPVMLTFRVYQNAKFWSCMKTPIVHFAYINIVV